MVSINAGEVAGVVAQALQKNPGLVERFKSHPHETIENVSGINGLSATDIGSILNTLLSGSNEGGGMLSGILGILIDGSKTKSGDRNIVGDLIKQVVGGNDSQDKMGTIIASLLLQTIGGGSSTQKETEVKPAAKTTSKSTAKPAAKSTSKATTSKTTAAKPAAKTTSKTTTAKPAAKTTSKSTAKPAAKTTASSSSKSKASSKKEPPSKDILGTISSAVDRSGIDVGDLVNTLINTKKK